MWSGSVGCYAPSPSSLYDEAYASFRGERYPDAQAKLNEGIRRTGPDADLYWNFRLLQAQILLGKREALNARKALEFELPPRFRTPRNLGRMLLCKGFAASLLQDPVTARALLDQADAQARAAGNNELLAEIRNRQGVVAVGQSRFDEADKLFHSALTFATDHSVSWLAVSATGNLGYALMRAHRYDEAIPFFEHAAEAAHRAETPETEARNVGNLGQCYYRIGDLDKAVQAFQQAEARFRLTGNRFERQVWLGNLGNIYLGRLEYAQAAAYYKEALAIARAVGNLGDAASWLSNLARISIETGDLDAAERYNNEGLALKQELNLKDEQFYSALYAARIAVIRGHFDEAEPIVRGILAGAHDPAPRLRAHDLLAILLADTHRYTEAENEYRTAIAELELERTELQTQDEKRAYLSDRIGLFQDYIEFLMDRGKVLEALEIADSSHAKTMLERQRLRRPGNLRTSRAADFQQLAKASGSTLLSYSLGRRKSYLWIITSDAIRPVVLPTESEFRPLIEAYDKSIQDLQDPLVLQNAAGHKLYNELIAPAAPYINRTGRVILIPDGLLYSLNFETLPVPGPNPHYWLEDVTVSIAPALWLLNPDSPDRQAGAGPAAQSLLLIGNPVSPDSEFPNLAFAAEEMSSIEAAFPQVRKVVLSGPDARPSAWTEAGPGDFDLVHFTAHATANQDQPLESAVILSRDSPGAPGGFKLHARDVVKTPLKARLITISACRGAGSRIYSGEGLVGLAWAFLDAGAKNVIAGLWDVNDESGAKTMAQLYAKLAAGRGVADSLREAKLTLIRSGGVYRKPWYWGAFQAFTTVARD